MSFQDYRFISYDIDESKLHLYTNVVTNYKAENGSYVSESIDVPMVKCKVEFMKSQFMRDAFELYDIADKYCIDQEDERIYFEGTKNDEI